MTGKLNWDDHLRFEVEPSGHISAHPKGYDPVNPGAHLSGITAPQFAPAVSFGPTTLTGPIAAPSPDEPPDQVWVEMLAQIAEDHRAELDKVAAKLLILLSHEIPDNAPEKSKAAHDLRNWLTAHEGYKVLRQMGREGK